MKPTTIRNVTLRPGSTVYAVMDGVPEYHIAGLPGNEPFIKTLTIKATNGTSFAFARNGSRPKSPFYFIDEPECYLVTEDEAKTELARHNDALLGIARTMLERTQEKIRSYRVRETKLQTFIDAEIRRQTGLSKTGATAWRELTAAERLETNCGNCELAPEYECIMADDRDLEGARRCGGCREHMQSQQRAAYGVC
jgi:hypothetical protein